MKDEFSTIRMTINLARARKFAPIFCFKARYIRKKRGEKEKRSREKNGAGDTRAERKTGEIKRKSVNGSFSLFRVRNLRDKERIKDTRSAMCSKSFPVHSHLATPLEKRVYASDTWNLRQSSASPSDIF